jgi:hypothetical protein
MFDEINELIISRENTKIKQLTECLEIDGNGLDVEISPGICHIRFQWVSGFHKIVFKE